MSEFKPPRPSYPAYLSDSGHATELTEQGAELMRQNAERLAAKIKAATEQGKEPFDYARFVEMYWYKDIQSDGLTGQESQATINSFIRRYYLDYPDMMTMADFARALSLNDMCCDS
jgi:hypothetical protein